MVGKKSACTCDGKGTCPHCLKEKGAAAGAKASKKAQFQARLQGWKQGKK